LISKIAVATSNKIIKDFDVANQKVEGQPKNIEELSQIREYMA